MYNTLMKQKNLLIEIAVILGVTVLSALMSNILTTSILFILLAISSLIFIYNCITLIYKDMKTIIKSYFLNIIFTIILLIISYYFCLILLKLMQSNIYYSLKNRVMLFGLVFSLIISKLNTSLLILILIVDIIYLLNVLLLTSIYKIKIKPIIIYVFALVIMTIITTQLLGILNTHFILSLLSNILFIYLIIKGFKHDINNNSNL